MIGSIAIALDRNVKMDVDKIVIHLMRVVTIDESLNGLYSLYKNKQFLIWNYLLILIAISIYNLNMMNSWTNMLFTLA